MSRPFEVVREIDLPAAPDDVWTAITAENAAWQFPGMELDPAAASPPEGSPITTWDPPSRLVIRMDAPDGTFNALEYAIEARDGGTAHVRYVHSGILSDEWEDQYDAVGPHTDFYFHTLGQYLEHFRGQRVTYVGQPTSGIEAAPAAAGAPDAMDRLRAALGIAPDAQAGDRVQTSLGAAGPLDGVIDYVTPQFIGLRDDDGLWRFFGRNHFGGVVGMSAHVFRDDVDPVAAEAVLQEWLDGVYA
ncbi:hypothetical protein DSM112329_05096 [Paraconexibacter sp. AEG42_29]|uniref:SRPBCC domain-containing protein n=1 Tax=Paraconexibacter sp. AEG42_29 TaxID=2997339 RepID=A0AAU7B2L2_9ACTN